MAGHTGGEGCPHHPSQQRKGPQGPFLVTASIGVGVRASPAQAVFTHFWIKLFLAAPASFLSAAAFSHWVALSAAPSVFTHF